MNPSVHQRGGEGIEQARRDLRPVGDHHRSRRGRRRRALAQQAHPSAGAGDRRYQTDVAPVRVRRQCGQRGVGVAPAGRARPRAAPRGAPRPGRHPRRSRARPSAARSASRSALGCPVLLDRAEPAVVARSARPRPRRPRPLRRPRLSRPVSRSRSWCQPVARHRQPRATRRSAPIRTAGAADPSRPGRHTTRSRGRRAAGDRARGWGSAYGQWCRTGSRPQVGRLGCSREWV